MSDMPELINQVYNYDNGDKLYQEVLSQINLPGIDNHIEFIDNMLRQCMPMAAINDMPLGQLVGFAVMIANSARIYQVYNQQEIINFIHRLLARKFNETK